MNSTKIILAVSGGVDSMVLLNMVIKQYAPDSVIVAHFDHGTRKSSATDAEFVKNIALSNGCVFVSRRLELGEDVSEELARQERYKFLRKVAQDNGNAPIYTAHHLDDLVETIAINLLRGTGWRGLAVLDAPGIYRPFLDEEFFARKQIFDKKMIMSYAANHRIIFREDPTNSSDKYLRNRLRRKTRNLDYRTKKEIFNFWQRQRRIKREIDLLTGELLPQEREAWERSWFNQLDDMVAIELLRAGTLAVNIPATRPQLRDFLFAIRTYKSGKAFNLPQDHLVKFTKIQFFL